jgi:putative FmdB family regulatory protein
MPTYEFKCKGCQQTVSVTSSMSELKTPKCLQCLTFMHRVFSVNGVTFKGRGFYTTDKKGDE